MGIRTFTSNNRAATFEKMPKLSLEKGESARVVVFEPPMERFVHNLRAPKIVDGVVQYVRDKNGKLVMEMDFIGNPICLGSEEALEKSGQDARNCPACKAITEHGADMFSPPTRKYALHTFQYNTNGSSKAPATLEGAIKIWTFSATRFNEILDIAESVAEDETELSHVDLLLGPCEAKTYQNYKMMPSRGPAAYLALGKERFQEIVDSNKSKDITQYIGRKMGREMIEDKVDDVVRKWRESRGQKSESRNDDYAGAENLDAGLASILDDEPKPVAAPVASRNESPAKEESFEDILGSLE